MNWGEFEDECRAMQIPDNRIAFLLNNYLKTHYYRKAVEASGITLPISILIFNRFFFDVPVFDAEWFLICTFYAYILLFPDAPQQPE